MQPLPSAALAALRGPHRIRCWADGLVAGQVVETGIPITGGRVTMDRSQFVRRTVDLQFAELDPVFSAFGNELRVWRSIIANGTEWPVCLGTFGTPVIENNRPTGGVDVTGYDRCYRISKDNFPYARSFLQQSAITTARQLALESVPWGGFSTYNGVVDAQIQQVTFDSDRGAALTTLAQAVGGEMFSDALGEFVLQPIPDPAVNVAVWVIDEGPGGVQITATDRQDTSDTYNGFLVLGQSTGDQAAPQSALIIDNDPFSPTCYGGPFGHRVYRWQSSTITSAVQANTAALAMLRDSKGSAQSVSFSAVPNPALEVGDIIGVTSEGQMELHILQSLVVPLTAAEAMTGDTKTGVVTPS